MNTCKTCKWWREGGEHHSCALASYGAVRKDTKEFYVEDAPEGCSLITGPDFGCIHHEPKQMVAVKTDPLDLDTAKLEFRKTIAWMRSIASDKMKTKEGREWLEREWCIKVEPWKDGDDSNH